MLISLILITAIAAGGFGLTYLIDEDGPFLWRASAGAVIGSAIFGTISFVLAMAAGLNPATVIAALMLTLLPIVLILRGPHRTAFQRDWARAKGKLKGASRAKAGRFMYYAGFAVLFLLFFSQTMYETAQGVFTGGSNNLGDLPYHLGAILSFSDGANFPPINPSFAGAKFSYPFISDLITACFMKLGAGLREAMFVQNTVWAFSLLVILERFVLDLIDDRLAAKLAPPLLFFSGGFGFIWFLGDFSSQTKGFFDFLWHIPKDYTIGDEFRWGNSLITLFMTQRSLLLGMPLTLVVLGGLWKIYKPDVDKAAARPSANRKALAPILVLGTIAGLLPLVHLHSLVVLFVVTGFLFFLRMDKWKEWLAFGLGVCILAIPQLIWSITGSATETTKFFAWHFGWDSRDNNVLWFWLKNTGLVFPMLAFGIYVLFFQRSGGETKGEKDKEDPRPLTLLLFYIPFIVLFLVSNVAKLAPWEWDNIKVLIYWFVGSLPFICIAVAWIWHRGGAFRVVAAACFLVLVLSGGLDVWRTISGQNKIGVFDGDAVKIAERLRRSVPAKTLFLNAPTYNSAIALTGRQSFMRYPGHLASHGIDYSAREKEVRMMYAGGPQAEELLNRYGIEYVLISPEERNTMAANQGFFSKYPVAAESGPYKVYKIR